MTDHKFLLVAWLIFAGGVGIFVGLVIHDAKEPQEMVTVDPVATVVFEDVPGARCYVLTRFEWTDEFGDRRWSINKEFSCIPWDTP